MEEYKNYRFNKERMKLYKEIKNKYNEGDVIKEGTDYEVLIYLYENYYTFRFGDVRIELNEIIGFKLCRDERWINTLGFYIIKNNGKLKGVSADYMCGKKRKDRSDIIENFRLIIDNEILDFKKKNNGFGKHCDHYYPFSYLLKDFMLFNNIILDDIKSNNMKNELELFKKYHRKYSILKLCEASDNLKKSDKLNKNEIKEIRKIIKNYDMKVRILMLERMGVKIKYKYIK
jgi:hypothetical protein